MDPQILQAVQQGEETIDALLTRSGAISGLIASSFPAQSLAAVGAEFAKAKVPADGKVPVNAVVTSLVSATREEAAIAIADFRRVEMWVRMKVPACSDGNNFGVDVQEHVIKEVIAMRTAIQATFDSTKDYHWQRKDAIEKLYTDGSKSEKHVSTTDSTDDEGKKKKEGKTETKESTSTSSGPSCGADLLQYLVAVDVKQYHTCYSQLNDLRDSYLRAHVLISKNMKRLADPRGEGDGSGGNVMSMF